MTRIAVVDHGAGNLVSIAQGLERAGATVDAGGDISLTAISEPLREWSGPLLGICVGLQLFFEHSEEDGTDALGLMPGRVSQIENAPLLPHIGWNDVSFKPDPIFAGVPTDATFYFVHSYAVVPKSNDLVIAETDYGSPFVAAARSGNRVGVQFHPERSGPAGLRLLANFVADCAGADNVA